MAATSRQPLERVGTVGPGTPDTLEWAKRNNMEAVKVPAFSPWSPLLASGGGRRVHLWKMTMAARLPLLRAMGFIWNLGRKDFTNALGLPGMRLSGGVFPFSSPLTSELSSRARTGAGMLDCPGQCPNSHGR